MANFQIDSLWIMEDTNESAKYRMEILCNPSGNIANEIRPIPNYQLRELLIETQNYPEVLKQKIVFEKTPGGTSNNIDFSQLPADRDSMAILLQDSTKLPSLGVSDKDAAGFINVKDTNYPPPYKHKVLGTPTIAYSQKDFSLKFKLVDAKFERDSLNKHLFLSTFTLRNISNTNYVAKRIALEWDRARPDLEAIVIYLKDIGGEKENDLISFPATGQRFYVQLDNYRSHGLPVIISEIDPMDENAWADVETKKMIIFIDSF